MENYTRVKLLGQGAFGTAYLCKHKVDGKQYVVKEIDTTKMSRPEKDAAEQEAKLLMALDHPNVVRCSACFVNPTKVCIILDYCSEGDLSNMLKNRRGAQLSEDTILDWFVQLCLGLKHVHDRKILHRDLKTQNIFVSAGGLMKLGDFGVSKVLSSTMALASTAVGTPYYLSPEICMNRRYNQKSDIWSMGCILYELATLKHAFEAPNLRALISKIIRGSFLPLPSSRSKELRDLVAATLSLDPSRRPTVNQMLNMPVLKARIQNFLSRSLQHHEFSHTMIHGRPTKGQLLVATPPAPPPAAEAQAPGSTPAAATRSSTAAPTPATRTAAAAAGMLPRVLAAPQAAAAATTKAAAGAGRADRPPIAPKPAASPALAAGKPSGGIAAVRPADARSNAGYPKPPSQPTSRPGSQPSSRPGSQPGSRPGSQPSSRPGSQPSSRPGSQPPSRPGSQPTSAAPSRAVSQPGSRAPSNPNSCLPSPRASAADGGSPPPDRRLSPPGTSPQQQQEQEQGPSNKARTPSPPPAGPSGALQQAQAAVQAARARVEQVQQERKQLEEDLKAKQLQRAAAQQQQWQQQQQQKQQAQELQHKLSPPAPDRESPAAAAAAPKPHSSIPATSPRVPPVKPAAAAAPRPSNAPAPTAAAAAAATPPARRPTRPAWVNVDAGTPPPTAEVVQEAAGEQRGRPSVQHTPSERSGADLTPEQRRQVWEEMRAAAQRNKQQHHHQQQQSPFGQYPLEPTAAYGGGAQGQRGAAAPAAPSSAASQAAAEALTAEQRRQVWEEMRAAAQRNKQQLQQQHLHSPGHMSPQGRASDASGGDPDVQAASPLAASPSGELTPEQRRQAWQEMREAAKRNKQQLQQQPQAPVINIPAGPSAVATEAAQPSTHQQPAAALDTAGDAAANAKGAQDDLTAEQRRQVWQEMREAAKRNKQQLQSCVQELEQLQSAAPAASPQQGAQQQQQQQRSVVPPPQDPQMQLPGAESAQQLGRASSSELTPEQRRQAWEDMRAAAVRNKQQLQQAFSGAGAGADSWTVPAVEKQHPQPTPVSPVQQQQQDGSSRSSSTSQPAACAASEDAPGVSPSTAKDADDLGAAVRRQVWQEMRDAAQRNKRALLEAYSQDNEGASPGAAPEGASLPVLMPESSQARSSAPAGQAIPATTAALAASATSSNKVALQPQAAVTAAADGAAQQVTVPQVPAPATTSAGSRPRAANPTADEGPGGEAAGGAADAAGDPGDRRRQRLEEDRRQREQELLAFQRAHWQEVKAAAQRNRQQVLEEFLQDRPQAVHRVRGTAGPAAAGAGHGTAGLEESELSEITLSPGAGGFGAGSAAAADQEVPAGVTSTDADACTVDFAAMVMDMQQLYGSNGLVAETSAASSTAAEREAEEGVEDGWAGFAGHPGATAAAGGVGVEDAEQQATDGRFLLGQQEVQLPVPCSAPLSAKLEALRQLLQERLGQDIFARVYRRLESLSVEDDEVQVSHEFVQMLGEQKLQYLELVHQLIICEETVRAGGS